MVHRFTLAERMTMWMLHRMSAVMYGGTSIPVLQEGIKTLGLRGYFRFLKVALKVTTELQKEFGEQVGQHLIGIAAMWLGCAYCGYNHVMSGTLIYFRDTGEVHPLTPQVMGQLFDMRDEEGLAHLQSLLAERRHQRLRALATRMYSLYMNTAKAETADDDLLLSCLSVWRWTTECTIVEGVAIEPDDAWPIHEVGRNRALIERYKTAVAASRKEPDGDP